MPSKTYTAGGKFSKSTIDEVFRRQGGICPICRGYLDPTGDGDSNMGSSWDAHHIIFRSKGGSNSPDNCVILCSSCHHRYHRVVEKCKPKSVDEALRILLQVIKIRQTMGYTEDCFGRASFDDALKYYIEHYL